MTRPAGAAHRPFLRGLAAATERGLRAGLVGVVKAYRLLLSPMLGTGCRFTPSCSAYALVALERHGAGRGSYLTLARLARCHPWCQGGIDEVPGIDAAPGRAGSRGLFSRLLSPPPQKNIHE